MQLVLSINFFFLNRHRFTTDCSPAAQSTSKTSECPPFLYASQASNQLGFLELFRIFPWLELNLELFEDKWVRVNMYLMLLNSMNKTDCVAVCHFYSSHKPKTHNSNKSCYYSKKKKKPYILSLLKIMLCPADQIFCSKELDFQYTTLYLHIHLQQIS